LDKQVFDERNILISYFRGDGTFNVSIVKIEEGILEIVSTAGNVHLGGEDLDNRMVEYFIREFRQKKIIKIYQKINVVFVIYIQLVDVQR